MCVFLLLYSEKGKVDTSVVTMFEKAGVTLKVEVFSMFQNENTFRLEQVVLKYQVGYACQFFQGIRRVSKDEIELQAAFLDVFEYIGSSRDALVRFDLAHDFADEGMVLRVFLYGDNLIASS